MDRAAWLEWRRQGLGGSDIGAILGLSKWSGPWDIWVSKVHGEDDDRDDRSRMTGRLLEEAVGKWAASRLATELLDAKPYAHPNKSWLLSTPDYWIFDGDAGLECKTAEYPRESEGWGPDGSDQVPPSYDAQCRWYMAVTGRATWYLAVFFKRSDEWRIYRLDKCPLWEGRTIEFAETWWQHHIVDRNHPDADSSRACDYGLAEEHPKHNGRLRVATEAEEEAVRVYAQVTDQIAELDTNRHQLRNHLRDLIGDEEGIRFTGGRATWHRPSNRLTVRIRE